MKNKKKQISEANKRPILQFDLKGNFIKQWDGAIDVEKELNINRKYISACFSETSRRKTAGGYIWKRKGEQI